MSGKTPDDRRIDDGWDDLTWEFLDEDLTVDLSCDLENPESCESCQ